jgi:hypothetical protein
MRKLTLSRQAAVFCAVLALLTMTVAANATTITMENTGTQGYPNTDTNWLWVNAGATSPGAQTISVSSPASIVLNTADWPLTTVWMAAPPGSGWIGPSNETASGSNPVVYNASNNSYYIYQEAFTISGTSDPSTVLITGAVASDNCPTAVWINGQALTNTSGALMPSNCGTGGTSFTTTHTFAIGGSTTPGSATYDGVGSFHTGTNYIEFVVYNDTSSAPNPTGLLVTGLSGTVNPAGTVPEPATAGLLGIGIAAAALIRRRLSRSA